MKNIFSTENLVRQLKSNAFIQHSNMPMGYVPGLPILCILNGNLCMKVPFLKYKVTGEVDKTFVYPIHYLATVIIPEGKVVCFEDLSLNTSFANVPFSDPVGTFRHEAVKNLDKKAYDSLRSSLYSEYDKIVARLIEGTDYSFKDEQTFKRLFNTILEPSLRPFYQALDSDFTNKYMTK